MMRALKREWTKGKWQFQLFMRTPEGGTLEMVSNNPEPLALELLKLVYLPNLTTEKVVEVMKYFQADQDKANGKA